MGSPWVNDVLAVISVLGAAVFLVAAVGRPTERTPFLSHAAMGLGMAVMFSPWPGLVPATAGVVVFAVIGSWFAARWWREGRRATAGAAHLVIGPAAMVLMYLAVSGPMEGPAAGTAGMEMTDPAHPGHTMTMGGGSAAPPATAAVALVLVGYFAWYAWTLTARLADEPPTDPDIAPTDVPTTGVPATGVPATGVPATGVPATGVAVATARPSTAQIVLAARVVESVLMAVMFLGMV